MRYHWMIGSPHQMAEHAHCSLSLYVSLVCPFSAQHARVATSFSPEAGRRPFEHVVVGMMIDMVDFIERTLCQGFKYCLVITDAFY